MLGGGIEIFSRVMSGRWHTRRRIDSVLNPLFHHGPVGLGCLLRHSSRASFSWRRNSGRDGLPMVTRGDIMFRQSLPSCVGSTSDISTSLLRRIVESDGR